MLKHALSRPPSSRFSWRDALSAGALGTALALLGACSDDAPASSPNTTSTSETPDGSAARDAGASDARVGTDAARSEGGSAHDGDAAQDANAPTAPPVTDGKFTVETTTYAQGDAHEIELWLPRGEGPFPVIVYVHGGAWSEGDYTEAEPLAPRQAARGYAVASIDYRLTSSGKSASFPAPIQDVKAAVRWLRAHATTYHLDSERFAAWGFSAGAHLAELLGTSGGVSELEDLSLGSPNASSRVRAVIGWSGPTDFLQMDAQTVSGCANAGHDGSGSPESVLVGCAVQTCPEKVAEASPITYVDASDPPFLLMHGTKDCTVPPGQARLLDDALRAHGVSSTLVLIDGMGHDEDGIASSEKRMKQVEDFLDHALYP
jgi:acetyl esterase/lipase